MFIYGEASTRFQTNHPNHLLGMKAVLFLQFCHPKLFFFFFFNSSYKALLLHSVVVYLWQRLELPSNSGRAGRCCAVAERVRWSLTPLTKKLFTDNGMLNGQKLFFAFSLTGFSSSLTSSAACETEQRLLSCHGRLSH